MIIAWISLLAIPSVLVGVETHPNVIFILADDLGIGNVGCYGADRCKTPNIDHLASRGIRFTNAYTAALCGPSRALIMTGRYAFRNGSSNQDACTTMNAQEIVLPKLFKSAGYDTSSIGKWGQLPGNPGDHGFDDYFRFKGSGVYWNQEKGNPEPYFVNGEELKLRDDEYMPNLMHEHLMGFVKQQRSKPFFIYYCMSHVHGDIQPTPDSPSDCQDLFADNVQYMDKLVGKLVRELESLQLIENTLLIFMGDNGTGKGQAAKSTIGGRALSGMKGSMQECGGLVPLIIHWPAKLKTSRVSSNLVDSTDFVATFSELLQSKLPQYMVFDGHSFAYELNGKPGTPRDWVYNQLASMWYVRDQHWKLNQLGELYDMHDAPFTEKLVAPDSQQASAVEARKRLASVLAKLDPAGGIPDSGDGTGRHANKKRRND